MYSVIIPTLNEGPNLWYTIHNLQQNWHFMPDGHEHELLVVDCGSTDNTIKFMNDYGIRNWAKLVETTENGPGPTRQAGASRALGDILFFIDANVLLPPDFFVKALRAMEEVWDTVGTMHFPTKWNWHGDPATHYSLTLEKNFCGDYTPGGYKVLTEIGASGHACIAMRADRFRETHGYPLPQTKYGGEETYVDIKMAMFGYRNYVLGNTHILHCSQRRQLYEWDNDSLFRNHIMAANMVGGDEWARKVLESHKKEPGWDHGILNMLYEQGVHRSAVERRFVEISAKMTLEDVLADWAARYVPH